MRKPTKYKLKDKDYLDLWKYCEEVGGRDKDRMVATVTWLLAFAIGLLGYIVKFWKSLEVIQKIIFGSAGMLICGLAGVLIYAFGAYANRYWYMADWIKEKKIEGLHEFHDKKIFIDAIEKDKATKRCGRFDNHFIKCFSRDKPATQGLLGVFKVFLVLTCTLGVMFAGVIVCGFFGQSTCY